MRANHNFFSSWNSSFLYPRLTGTISKPRLTCNASNERSIDRSAARKIVRLFSHLLTFVSSSPPAWSKLAKFRHFGKIVKLFDKLSKHFLILWHNFEPSFEKNYAFGPVGIVVNGQILKSNLAIWSHCSPPVNAAAGAFTFSPFKGCVQQLRLRLLQ